MKKIVPIVYASDENFLRQTYVSIYSVLANRKGDYDIKFFILTPEDCPQCRYDAKWNYNGYSIVYIKISKEYFQNVSITLQNITKPTFYRLVIPFLLPQYDKCIYLDGDTICCDDILELYETDLENNLIAAAKGAIMNFNAASVAEILDVPNAEQYINAGVLVMNLNLMRQNNLVEEFISYSTKNYPCQDQDVLNKCCYGKIKFLPLKDNVYCNVFVAPEEITKQRFCKEEIEEAINSPAIIHYPREYSKPWKNVHAAEGHRWWQYAESALSEETLFDLRKASIEWLNRYSYKDLYNKVEQCSKLVLFGYSEIGCKLCNELDKRMPNKIVAFCDNDKKKQGLAHNGYKVIDAVELKMKFSDALIVITSQNYCNAIREQLLEMGFLEDKIAIYRKKIIDYLYSFEKSYFSRLWEDICLDNISSQELMRTALPLVSIVIPVYNREGSIQLAVDSVLNQTYQNIEVIVVDDGSTDHSVEMLAKYAADDRVKILCQEGNYGANVARNRGIIEARGEYIAFHDSDDEWLPDKLEKQISYMIAGRLAACFCSFRKHYGKDMQVVPEIKGSIDNDFLKELLKSQNIIGTPTLVIKTEIVEKVGMFDESMPRLQDYEFVIRIIKQFKIGFINEVLVDAYQVDECISKNSKSLDEALLLLLNKHADFINIERIWGDYLTNSGLLNDGNMSWDALDKAILTVTVNNPYCSKEELYRATIEVISRKYNSLKEYENYSFNSCIRSFTSGDFAIYGAGNYARKAYYEMKGQGLLPQCFVVTEAKNNSMIDGIPVVSIDDWNAEKRLIILAVSGKAQRDIRYNLEKRKMHYYIYPDCV